MKMLKRNVDVIIHTFNTLVVSGWNSSLKWRGLIIVRLGEVLTKWQRKRSSLWCYIFYPSVLLNSIPIKLACHVLKTLFFTIKRVLIRANGLISTIRNKKKGLREKTRRRPSGLTHNFIAIKHVALQLVNSRYIDFFLFRSMSLPLLNNSWVKISCQTAWNW